MTVVFYFLLTILLEMCLCLYVVAVYDLSDQRSIKIKILIGVKCVCFVLVLRLSRLVYVIEMLIECIA